MMQTVFHVMWRLQRKGFIFFSIEDANKTAFSLTVVQFKSFLSLTIVNSHTKYVAIRLGQDVLDEWTIFII